MQKTVVLFFVALFPVVLLDAEDRPEFLVLRAQEPPKIDGALEDEVWQDSPLTLGDWMSYSPLRGEQSTFRTEVRIAYDERYLYFAFDCFDPEPAKIRTTISRPPAPKVYRRPVMRRPGTLGTEPPYLRYLG